MSIPTSRPSQDALQSPQNSAQSPKPAVATAPATSPTAVAHPSSQPSDEAQLSKVAILLAIEKVDAEIEAVNSKLAALARQLEEDRSRFVKCFFGCYR